jgi:hypothetical protein
MSTTSETKNGAPKLDAGFAPNVDAAFDQFKQLNEQFLAAGRKAGSLYIDSYERAVNRAIEMERKVAGVTQQEWLKSLIEAQADFASDLATSYTTAARTLLK